MFNIFSKYRSLTKAELLEIQELIRIVNHERFKAAQVKGNSALVPGGQKLAAQLEATTALYEDVKNRHIAQKLAQLGYPKDTKTTIDLMTGKITIVP